MPDWQPAERRGLLRACPWGFADPPVEAAFAVFKSQAVWGLAGPLLVLEAAAFVALGRDALHPRHVLAAQLLPAVAFLLLLLLSALALLLFALARRGGAWRRAAARRERLACAARAARTMAAVVVVASGRRSQGLLLPRRLLDAAGAQTGRMMFHAQVGRSAVRALSDGGVWTRSGRTTAISVSGA
jgi:hypothetical protein